jgi:hypothetical protein
MNDIAGMLGQVARDQSGYYLLGFDPGFDTFDRKFHRVRVRVKRPGLRVRSREGYLAVEEPAPKRLSRSEELVKAMNSPFHSHDVPLKLTALYTTDEKRQPHVNCLIHADMQSVPKGSELDVAVMSFGPDGAPAGQTIRMVRLDGPELRVGVEYPISTVGPHQVRVALRHPDSGRTASAAEFLDVPNLKDGKLAVGSIALSDPARRIYHPGDDIHYGVLIYNARQDRRSRSTNLDVAMRILSGERVVHEAKPQPLVPKPGADISTMAAQGAFKVSTPGEYTLELTVTDHVDKPASSTQWVDFTLVPR